jgi:hypothetical protein
MTNTINHLYTVTNLITGKVVTLGSILEISMHTGYGMGFLSTRIRPYRGNGTYRLDNWTITFRKRKKGENYLIDRPDNASKIDLKTSLGYSILIGELNGFCYYITTQKQLQKSKLRYTTNNKKNYTVDHYDVTEQDLALFDLEKEYEKHIGSWKNKRMYRGDIQLINQLVDDILIIKKRKSDIKNFGKDKIR